MSDIAEPMRTNEAVREILEILRGENPGLLSTNEAARSLLFVFRAVKPALDSGKLKVTEDGSLAFYNPDTEGYHVLTPRSDPATSEWGPKL